MLLAVAVACWLLLLVSRTGTRLWVVALLIEVDTVRIMYGYTAKDRRIRDKSTMSSELIQQSYDIGSRPACQPLRLCRCVAEKRPAAGGGGTIGNVKPTSSSPPSSHMRQKEFSRPCRVG